MNPIQFFDNFVNEAVDKGLKPSEVNNERGRIYREKIHPALVKQGATERDLINAQRNWNQRTDAIMKTYNFLAQDGKSMRSAEKDLRADRAVREASRTGSQLPIIKETILSTGDTLANAFGTGGNQMVSAGARFINDIGENEKDTVSDRIANFADSNAKAFGKASSTQQDEMQSGRMGKAAQLGIGGVQSLPAMAMPFGVAGGVAKGASMALGAGKAAATIGATTGLVAGHTQNYGEVRRGATDNLKRDFPTADSLQGNPVYEQKFTENYNGGMSIDAAKQQAYTQTIDHLSEHAADVYGTAMTALDVIAPDGALLGSGLLKYLPNNKLTRMMGAGTDTRLVQRQFNQAPRAGLSKLMPDTSWAANKAGLGIVAREGLQEGSQGAVGEYGSQAASADIGGRPVEWNKVGQSFVDEAIVGGIMGAGMRFGSGHTPTAQAKQVADQIKAQTSSVIQDEAQARQNLSQAMQFANPVAIQEAQADLNLVKQRATALRDAYEQHGLEFPSVIDGMINPIQSTTPVSSPTVQTQPNLSGREQQQQKNAERLANQQQFEQVYGKGTPNPVIDIASIDPAVIDQSKLPDVDIAPEKPSISSIVNKHQPQQTTPVTKLSREEFIRAWQDTSRQDNNPPRVDFVPDDNGVWHAAPIVENEGQQQQDELALTDFGHSSNPVVPDQFQDDLSLSIFEPAISTTQYIDGENNVETNASTNEPNATGISEPATSRTEDAERPLQRDETNAKTSASANVQGFKERLLNAHLNDPNSKTKIINDEIATGRPRHEVLAEVSKIIDQYNQNKKNDDDSDGSIVEPTTPKPNTPPVPENGIDENIDENGELENQIQDMEYGDIGRKSDGLPFANKNAAKNYQKKYSLENTHDIVQLGKGTKFVLRPKSSTPLSEQVDETGVFAKYNEILRQYGRSVTASGVILTNKGKDTGVRIVEKNKRMRIESSTGKLLFSGSNPNSLNLFLNDYWGDVKLDEGELSQVEAKPTTETAPVEKKTAKPKTIGSGDNAKTYVGDNQQGQSLYADKNGVRSILEDGILNTEAVPADKNTRESRYKTIDELKETPTQTIQPSKNNDQFANNKIFTNDAVEKARARLKKKLGNLNSGIDPEVFIDGMTIAGAYIESGVRNFGDYARAMVADFGEDIKPYLLSFWEGARHYPDLDTQGMTSVEESKQEFDVLNQTANLSENMKKVVGDQISRPKGSKKPKVDDVNRQLVQDWGVRHIDGWATNNEHLGKVYSDYGVRDGVKAAFLKDAKNYLEAVQGLLEQKGYSLHLDKKGKPEKISVNESGTAGSGDVALYMTNIKDGTNVYATVSESFLASSHPQRISIMFRATTDLSNKQASGLNNRTSNNQWVSASYTASELAESIHQIARRTMGHSPSTSLNEKATEKLAETTNNQQVNEDNVNERLTNDQTDTSGKDKVRERGSDPQHRTAQADHSDVGTEQSSDGKTPEQAARPERSGVRSPREDVESEPAVSESRDASDGRTGTGRERSPDAGRGSTTTRPSVSSDSAVKVTAHDFHLDNPLDIVGGTPVQRFDKNRKALELLDELESEGRQATPEEQKVLAGYIGWGSFGQDLFQGTWDKPVYRDQKAWENRSKWLRERLGEQAWKSAQRSITNAHYTDPHTVTTMWDMLRRMGVDGGRILEPAMGTGNFFSMMPSDIKQNSQLTGIELDITTGAIAKQLFPNSNIQVMGYQDSKTPDNFYDVVVSNFPFENTPIADRKYNKLNPMLHDYFFLKAIDQVRAGGLVMSITSAGTMDKQGQSIRRELAKSAELVAAIRLPSGAFKEYAGTDVVTDIIILRKRPERLATVPADSGWINVQEVDTPSGTPVKVNEYYASHPQNIIGTLDYGHGTTTFKAGMVVHRPENMLERLQEAVKLVPENALQAKHTEEHLTYFANKTGERHGALGIVDGELMIAVGDQMVKANEHTKYELKDSKKTAQREQGLKDVIGLRKLYSDLVDAERGGNVATAERKALNKAYQDYIKSHGPLRDSFALSYLERIDDPFFASIAALENDDGSPATILKKSTTRGKSDLANPTISDAYIIARNQSISPNIEQIAKIANRPVDEVRKELISKGAVFETPNGDVAPTDMYLSGNVREKLREAQAALDAGNTAMQKNVDALKEVMPVDIPYFNIETKMGAAWIPAAEYQNYIAHMLNRDSSNGIEVRFKSGRWSVSLDKNLKGLTEAHSNFGSPHIAFDRLVQAALSNQTLRLNSTDNKGNKYYDAQKSEEANASLAKIREEFGTWLWSDAERKVQMEREYNEAMNAWATPKYDGSFMSMEGMALQIGDNAFNLRQHQQDAIWRAIANRRSMNAHEVGTGKTFTMGGIAVESRRYGIAKKPLLLAHNANSASVAAEIRMMYPSARVLYISELSPKVRALRLRQIANDDWDVVVMPHSMIDRLTLNEDTLMAMAADDIAALEEEFYAAAKDDGVSTDKVDLDDEDTFKNIRSVTAKELAKARKTIIENIKKQAQQSSREDAVSFEELGVDMILVDEVQEFKKPPIVTRMRMKGLNTQTSQRSIALQFLTRYIRSNNNGGNVHTFTGTYITNTITEIFHQMKYVMEEEMKKTNVADWDGWFGSFASELQDVELSAAGEYEMVTRLAGFVNVPELRRMVGQFMDTVFAEDMPEMKPRKTKTGKVLTDPSLTEAERVELLNGRTEGAADRPYKKIINESAEMTDAQKEVFDHLQQLSREWRIAEPKQRKEWMVKGDEHSPIIVEGKANKASLDVRLNDESLAGMEGQTKDDPNSKASRVVKNVVEIYNSHPHANQVIFTDNGFNTSVQRTARDGDGGKSKYTVKVFSTVNDIVARLVQQGIPRNQIAVVTGTTSKEKRREIANAMNQSIIRVVIGSTDTLGVGVNMQRNLRAMHHLDAPYMPGDLEQRNGRGLRQANQWNTVLEYRYMTDRLDGRRWQILAVKQRFINAFMKANSNVRVIEGEAAADEQSDILESFSEAAGDPRVLQRVKLRKKLDSLQRKERLHSKGIADIKQNIRSEEKYHDQLSAEIKKIQDSKLLENLYELLKSQQDNFVMEVDGKPYTSRKDATEAIESYVEKNVRLGTERHKFATYAGHPVYIEMNSFADSPLYTIWAFGEDFDGHSIRGAEMRMRNVPKSFNTKVDALKSTQQTIENLKAASEQPFGQQKDLKQVEKQLADLELDLEHNPVPPPTWLRQGAPIDSEVFHKDKSLVVMGHRYADDNYYVIAEDEKGMKLIPYTEVTDQSGMPIYEQHDFVAPEVVTKTKDNQETPLYSRKDDLEFVHEAMTELAAHDELFRYPVSQKKTLQAIFKDVMGDEVQYIGEVTATDERQESTADHKYLYRIKGKDFYVYERDNGEIWVDVSRLNEGDQGAGIFAAFGNYAHNANKVIVRDPEGLSEAAVVRATSAMLSLALRFGTTRFFEPATEQLRGNPEKGIAPLKWYTNDVENIRSLIDTFLQTTQNQIKGIEGYRYDFRTGQFLDPMGRPVRVDRFRAGASRSLARTARAGFATSRRVIFLQSLASSKSGERPQLLEQIVTRGRSLAQSPELTESFSKNQGVSKTGNTPDQVRKILVDRFGESTIAKLEQQGILEIVDTTPSNITENGIEGYYLNGKVTLVADNLTAATIIPTFLHELGGHAGFQGLMKPSTYQNLMDSFNSMVEAGNPIAVEAKRRAEAEKITEQQQLEYLPYLLTVASEGRFGNSVQQGAISRLINRIKSAIRAFMVDKFGLRLDLNPDDMVALAERMIQKSVKQPVQKHQQSLSPLFSRVDTSDPESLPKSKQKEILDAVGKSAFGQLALLNAERAKSISKRTGSFFNTMLHKALQNGEFKKTFDLVQNKINHVTYASSASMDVAPGILTQLETLNDYKTEAKNVGKKLAHTLTAGKVARPQNEIDLERVGEILFTNTLSDEPKVYKVSELRALGFTDSQIDLYRQARNAIDTSLDEFAKTTVSNIFKHFGGTTEEILELTAKNLRHIDHVLAIKTRMNRIATQEPDKAEAAAIAEKHIDEVLEKLAKLKKEGYMPLMRFGKYYMRVIDPTTKEVAYRQHFESEAERNMFVRNFKVPDGYTVESSQTNELEHTMFQGVSPETLALFAKEAGLPTDNMQEAFIKHAVRDNHALKRLLRRKGIKGFNNDTKRVIAAFVLSNSRYAANQLFNPAIDESIVNIKDPAYAEDAIRLRDYALDPKEDMAGVKNFSFVWYMGASLMFGVVNLTQPLLQTLPYLLQYSKDWSVTGKAVLQAGKSWYGKDIPAKYKVAYERARKEGHLDPQNTWMLQGLERGKSGLGASTWQLISHASGFFAQASETVNRRAALFASLDVAEQMGQAKLEKFGFKDAYDFAVRTIQETQGIYNKGNRPRAARGNIGSLLMMYKQFMIAYVEQMVRMQRAGLYGGEDDEFKRRMAKLVGFGISRSLLVALGVLWSFAGATGLPFVRDILDAVETAGGMVGKPFNTEREVQIALHSALGDTLGESTTTLLLDGAFNLNPVVDVKGRMGMGDLIPGTGYFSPLTSEYQKSQELSSVGGAIGGLIEKVGDAMDFAKIGDYSQSATQLAPKAITSLLQGGNAAITGDYRNMKSGVKTNDASVLDGIVKALDAQPALIAKEGRVRGLEMKDKAAVQYNNKRAKEEYEEALATGDINEVNRVKQKIKDHNADNPRYPITLNLKTTETNFNKSNMSWQEKRKDTKGLGWMDQYNPYLITEN